MKKSKQKSISKSAKKEAKDSLEKRIIAGLTEAAGDLGTNSKKLAREIAKSARQLTKKLAKEISKDKKAAVNSVKEVKPDIIPVSVKAEPSKPVTLVKTTPVEKTAASTKTVATPVKTTTK